MASMPEESHQQDKVSSSRPGAGQGKRIGLVVGRLSLALSSPEAPGVVFSVRLLRRSSWVV